MFAVASGMEGSNISNVESMSSGGVITRRGFMGSCCLIITTSIWFSEIDSIECFDKPSA